jgi:hypothetical protein
VPFLSVKVRFDVVLTGLYVPLMFPDALYTVYEVAPPALSHFKTAFPDFDSADFSLGGIRVLNRTAALWPLSYFDPDMLFADTLYQYSAYPALCVYDVTARTLATFVYGPDGEDARYTVYPAAPGTAPQEIFAFLSPPLVTEAMEGGFSFALFCFTVILHDAVLRGFDDTAVMRTLPAFLPVTFPSGATSATFVLLLRHETVLSVASFGSTLVTRSVSVSPARRAADFLSMDIPVTGIYMSLFFTYLEFPMRQ